MTVQSKNFDQLLRRYYRLIVLYFINRGVDREEAFDLAQEVFTNAYTGLLRFRGDASERTWLFSIAKNVWRNWLRDGHRLKRDAPETPIDDLLEEGWEPPNPKSNFDPLTGTLENERVRKVWDAINTLPPRMRRCVMLRVGQEKKYREIADVMQISIQTVRSQLSQGRDQLRQLLGDYFEELR